SESLCASAFKLGVQDYFAKPVDLEHLLKTVRGLLAPVGVPLAEAETPAASPAELPPPEADLQIHKAVVLIHRQYWDNLTLGRVAREVGMSKFWLSRRFKAVMGGTFRHYL